MCSAISFQCPNCAHFHGSALTCDAFPSGIPEAIIKGDHDHTEPYPGDHGIRYETVDEEAE